MNVCVLTFDPTGNGSCLYSELIDLQSIGTLEVNRATNIEFNNGSQVWEVKDMKGMVLHHGLSRDRCLTWEQENWEAYPPVEASENERNTPTFLLPACESNSG